MIFVVHCENLRLQECYLITIFAAIVIIRLVNCQENLYDGFTEEVQGVKVDFNQDNS